MSDEKTKLVATRVPLEVWKTLQIGLVVENVETMQDLLRPIVEEYAVRLEQQPEVQAIAEKVETYQARKRRAKPRTVRKPRKASDGS